MGIKITLNYAALEKLEKAVGRATDTTIQELHTDVVNANVMPFDSGDMQNNETFIEVSEGADSVTAHLITGSPQARRLYYHPEYNFQTVNNADAGAYWLEDWIHGDKMDFTAETFAKNFKKEASLK